MSRLSQRLRRGVECAPWVVDAVIGLEHKRKTLGVRLQRERARAALAEDLLVEFISLCELGDVDETTIAHGWGDLIGRTKRALARSSARASTAPETTPPQVG